LIKAGGITIRCEVHKLVISVWNKEELPEEWKESIIVLIYKKGDKTDCNNYRGISLLPTTYNILSNILLSRLTQYAEEIIGDHQCGFRCNRSTTDHIFCIRQIREKKWEYNEAVHQPFIDFKKAYDSVRREVLYNILTEFEIHIKLVWLIEMCLNETYSRARLCKHLFDMFPVRNSLKQGHALPPLLFNFKIKIYRTIILPVVLYGCETWSLALREERRLRVFENRVFRRIRVFRLKRDKVTTEWRKLHNEELNDLYPSPNIGRVIKASRMRWAGHVAGMGERRDVYRVLVGKPEGKRPLGRPRRRWEDNIKMNVQEVGVWTGSSWLRIGTDGGHL